MVGLRYKKGVGRVDRLTSAPLGTSTLRPSGEHAVLQVERRVHVRPCRACASFHEALFEIVAQKSIQNGIHRGIGIAQTTRYKEHCYCDPGLTLVWRGKNQRDLHDPIW